MRFGILGPLRVGGGEATVTAGRDRTVLAMLLLRAGRVVPFEELVDAVWEERPPATARAQLQICVSRLRQRLARLGLPPEIIVTDPVGYGVRVDPADLDAEVFAREVETARAAVGAARPTEARKHYRTALALWRGPALSGIASRSVRRRAQALDEQRLAALEECVEVELRLRHGAELIDELTESVDQHPLRERLRGQLMLALSAVGRQADALAVYREGRRLYAEELGIEPGAALQELHQRVLAGDLALTGPEERAFTPVRALPRAISDFTGRQETVARLVKEIEEDNARIQLIDGMAGSGKTTLAVHLATALGERYPDAHLFIDLHGHSDRAPVSPAAALAGLLRQLGVPGERIPADTDERAALWRSDLSGRRAIVVLDNAASAAQVAPLLPNGRDCLTLITSRRRLTGLDGGRPSSLAVLDPEEAVELLARVVGADRVAAEPEAAAEVVHRCGHLPLAIRLAGARLAHRPRWRVRDLADRLVAGRDALTELSAGERSVGQAFALSYAQIEPAAQRLFRLLGLHPGAFFDNRVAAALADLPLPDAQDLLDDLVDAHLVDEPEPGRFRFHDLMREYARQLLETAESAADRIAAVERLLDHHLHVAYAISGGIEPVASRSALVLPEPPRPDLVRACLPEGIRWFDANRAALPPLVRLAAAEGRLERCWQLARTSWYYLFKYGHLDELVDTHTVALRAAEQLDDPAAIATVRNYLSSGIFRLGRFPEAIELMEVALELRQRLGDRSGEATVRRNLAVAYGANRQFAPAMAHLDAALALARATNQAIAVTPLLNNQAVLLLSWGRYAEARVVSRRQLALAREAGDVASLWNAIGHLGTVRARLGDQPGALRFLRLALRLKRREGNRFGEGEVLNELGIIERGLGRPEAAAALHREALAAVTASGDRIAGCTSRNLLARALLDQGDLASALDLHRRVLADANRLQARLEQARALDGIARCLRDADPAGARSHWTRALVLFRQLESPDQQEVARLLAELD
ncbi:DNA-binding transcriptional activator of the SARP family [Micromonospora rhizosphaerae]|uniref:DNA-binding transcriptional activator of the SARP family n=1 Tax=Micromonospora rhizosphaerae TaxID=568872 RepID=A0A1C6RBS6_9ACTN|nr:AfsR/SARP family transcriptional regulator [Micromonospora rhizosphaerae]SCL14527.1 DNA-binding transcriptional activator of the SARP family [Micromonospora rhizosphaerae]